MTQPAGAIHDIGYRHYDGSRLASRYAMRTLAVEGLFGAFGFGRSAKAKIMPLILLALLLLFALLIGAGAAMTEADHLEVRPVPFVADMLPILAIFVASQAPQLVSRDLRFRTISLYFSRPLRREEYLAAKVAAMTAAILFFLAVPLTVLTAGALLAKVPALHALDDWARGLGAALVAALVFGAVALAVAAFTPRRGLGVAAIIAVFLLSTGFAGALTGIGRVQHHPRLEHYAGLLSPNTIVGEVNLFLFRVPTNELAMPGARQGVVYLVAATLLVGACYALLLQRYRKVSVT